MAMRSTNLGTRRWVMGLSVLGLVAGAAAWQLSGSEDDSHVVTMRPIVDASASAPLKTTGESVAASVPVPHEGIFPVRKTIDIAGVPAEVRLTGQAIRKAMMIKFYQIASYCDHAHAPADVDALAAADCPKQLCLTMVRDVPKTVLERGFKESFAKNDPEGKFARETEIMLEHMLKSPLCEGETVHITHLPKQGIRVSVRNEAPIDVDNLAFAHVVWNVYMGPDGVCKELRRGLGEKLAAK
ncbi:MAG: hypothetical protein C0483_04290 [Pirellula sp.]|nr:hypothetical protein [Pirellula sp.]